VRPLSTVDAAAGIPVSGDFSKSSPRLEASPGSVHLTYIEAIARNPLVHSWLWIVIHSGCGTLWTLPRGHKRTPVHAFDEVGSAF
jgi:hypothetical protein